MNSKNKTLLVVGIIFGLSTVVTLAGDMNKKMIKLAKAAAPAKISDNATIMVKGEAVVKGSNGWVCMPETMPNDKSPMCNDALWQKMMSAVATKSKFKADGVGISYMMLGEAKGAGVSNSTPYHPNPKEAADYVETGPHLMIIVPKELLKGMNSDPSTGGPFVMWKDTPYAHIMIPVGE